MTTVNVNDVLAFVDRLDFPHDLNPDGRDDDAAAFLRGVRVGWETATAAVSDYIRGRLADDNDQDGRGGRDGWAGGVVNPPLSQREVNGLVMAAFQPTADAAREMFTTDHYGWGPSFAWGVGAGRSLYDTSLDGPVGVHVEGGGGRLRFHLPYDVAYEVAERVATDHPQVLTRINGEWWDEMAADTRDDARDDADAGWGWAA